MNIIVAVDKKWGIGNKGKLLVSIPRDKKLFREETTGKVIIMDKSLSIKGATVLNSVDACIDYLRKNNIKDSDVFVIGGESVYNDFLPYCDVAHITYIDYEYEADRHFLNLDISNEWSLVLETEEETYFDIPYTFRLYKRK